jgi:hypothetical protein
MQERLEATLFHAERRRFAAHGRFLQSAGSDIAIYRAHNID